MEYTAEVLDRTTGDLIMVNMGDWITVTELGKRHNVGSRQVRAILHHMGLLQTEGGRLRLIPHAVEKGLGKRIQPSKTRQYPFDVISPLGQQLIAEVWNVVIHDMEQERLAKPELCEAEGALEAFRQTRLAELTTQQEVCWLLDHFPNLNLQQVGDLLGVVRPLVSRYATLRSKQRSFAKRLRERTESSSDEQDTLWPGASKAEPPPHYAEGKY